VKLISGDKIQKFIHGSGWEIMSPVPHYFQASCQNSYSKKTQAPFLNTRIMCWKLNISIAVHFQIRLCPVNKQHHHYS